MRTQALIGALALAALVSFPALAGDPDQHTLTYAPVKLQKGDLFQVSGRLGHDIRFLPENKDEDNSAIRSEEQGWITSIQVDGLDRDGRVEKGIAYFDSCFVRNAGETEADQSVGGARVTFDRGRFREAGGVRKPSRTGGRWIKDGFLKVHLPETGLAWTKALQPPGKVAVGDEWAPDYAALASMLAKAWDCELSARDATGKVKFEEAFRFMKSPASTINGTISFPLTKAAPDRNGRRATLPKDARMDVSVRCQLAHEGRIPFRELHFEGRYRGEAEVQGKGKGDLLHRIWSWWGTKHDAWIPDPQR